MKKRVLPLLLAVILCLSLPVTALAAEEVNTSDLDKMMTQERTGTTTEMIDGKERTVYLYPAGTGIDTNKKVSSMVFAKTITNLDTDTQLYTVEMGPENGFVNGAPLANGLYLIENSEQMIWFWDYYVRIGAGSTTPTEPTEQPSSWAAEQVQQAVDAGIVPESLQSKYTQATTRAEFCALAVDLYETVKGAEITERKTFTDTSDVNVEKLAAIGVVSGMTETEFWPDSELTREQAAAMLARLANAIGKPLAASAPTFADNDAISSWAVDSVGQVQAAGIMSGMGENQFAPAGDYTREQSISTMLRLYNVVK